MRFRRIFSSGGSEIRLVKNARRAGVASGTGKFLAYAGKTPTDPLLWRPVSTYALQSPSLIIKSFNLVIIHVGQTFYDPQERKVDVRSIGTNGDLASL